MPVVEPSTFGTRLKEARLRAGLSQKRLGIAAGLDDFVASTRINRYELGIHQADYPFACKLAVVLDVPVAFFYANDANLAELIDRYGKAPKKRQAAILAMAREGLTL